MESVHATEDEAIAAAIAASQAEGPGGVVVTHESDCRIIAGDEETCTCTPFTLQLGATA